MEKVNSSFKPLHGFEAYTLIPATDNDFDFMYELKKIVLKEYIEQTWGWNEDFQTRFHKENFTTVNTKVIKVGHKRVGTVDVREDDRDIFISGLYILPEYQSKGIGSSILLDLQNRAEAGGKSLGLEVLRVNTKAQQLYIRLGLIMTEKDDKKFFMYKNYDQPPTEKLLSMKEQAKQIED